MWDVVYPSCWRREKQADAMSDSTSLVPYKQGAMIVSNFDSQHIPKWISSWKKAYDILEPIKKHMKKWHNSK